MLLIANSARNLTDTQYQSFSSRWQKRLAERPNDDWTRLRLAILLANRANPKLDALNRARDLLSAYLSDSSNKPVEALRFAQLELAQIDAMEYWQKAYRDERDAGQHWKKAYQNELDERRKLHQKLEALKAIELRMNQNNTNSPAMTLE